MNSIIPVHDFFIYKGNTYIVDNTKDKINSRLLFKGCLLVRGDDLVYMVDDTVYPFDIDRLYAGTTYSNSIIDQYVDSFVISNPVVRRHDPFKFIFDLLGVCFIDSVHYTKRVDYVVPSVRELYDAVDSISLINGFRVSPDGYGSYKKQLAAYLNVKSSIIKTKSCTGGFKRFIDIGVLRSSLKLGQQDVL